MNEGQPAKATAIVLSLLFILALGGFAGCIAFGLETHGYWDPGNPSVSREVAVDSGSNGGAIGCGIFGAVALFGFVKVFLAKTN